MAKTIALVGDLNDQLVLAHKAIPLALEISNSIMAADITWKWINTSLIKKDAAESLSEFSAIWVVPGSPYENMDGVLGAIRYARETGKPFLGTCGGFQHALVEHARNVCCVLTADHAETSEDGADLIVSALSCSLLGQSGQITYTPGSILYSIMGENPEPEAYHCSYGLNPQWRGRLENAGMQFTGFDSAGDVRAFELPDHPFFIGTLFQPEQTALQSKRHNLVTAFIDAVKD